MLKQRIITAVILLALFLPAFFYPDASLLGALSLAFIGAAVWEWSKLNQIKPFLSRLLGASCVMICLLIWDRGLLESNWRNLWLGVGCLWVMGSLYIIRIGVGGWQSINQNVRVFVGLIALIFTWCAIYQAKSMSTNLIFSILALVWFADIGAYFFGRAWGKRKLAPAISPGKSWEGVWGGMFCVIVLALIWMRVEDSFAWTSPSLFKLLWMRGWVYGLLSLLFLSAMSVVGDLFESLVKRSAGAKDSSQLLPGHGGVLDRVDALLPALPLSMMLVVL
ncbi:MAG: phosphatidate cytidylyltransferase [Limnohabitans sp.]|nr:phosphatidate cytidylyltransferase [Limnohabitans sp.]